MRLGKYQADLADLNDTATFLAQRALELDRSNLIGHAILARQVVVLGVPEPAEAGGVPEFPGPGATALWSALGGCVPTEVRPEASVAWGDVSEIKAGNWVLYFKLTKPVRVADDDGKAKELRELKVGLHGRTGMIEVYKPVGENHPATRGRGPAGFQDLVRRTLVKFVDPDKRIALPPLKPGVGW